MDPFDDGGGPPERPKLKKLRLALVLSGLAFIALVSTVFGMMMAVASDVPSLEDEARFKNAKNSLLFPDTKEGTKGDRLAKLTGNENRILLEESEIAPYIKNAVIAIEDKRFYEHRGVDYRGIGRALWQDVSSGSAKQGASTITQQFVKNALAAQGDRSVFQKLREAAAAYHLERKWSKQKILTQYLNSVYFGNGAYGVESAMRTYFGGAEFAPIEDQTLPDQEPRDFDKRAASSATPEQAAFLAGIIASPSAYDPLQNYPAATKRRDLVLDRMLEQGMITHVQHDDSVKQSVPFKGDVNPPQPDSTQPYFSTWVTQQLVDRYEPARVFGGGMKIQTTLDPDIQGQAEAAARSIDGIGPSASIVTIENETGEVKALVGGTNFRARPFNLATNGHRQPGSAIKTFTLLQALKSGKYGPGSTFGSHRKVIPYREPNGKKDIFVAENYENNYLGVASLATATAQSDNSVFAELGMTLKPKKIAKLAKEMGIRTKLSTNPAMTLGGLKEGVTPLEMAFAYSTLANNGKRVCDEFASYKCGPVGIDRVNGKKGKRRTKEVFSKNTAETAKLMLRNVVSAGTGKKAQVGEFAAGKTGTTENYGDAWFCGFIQEYTTCVWVGYADKVQPMQTEFGGSPVAGGTWPAFIWQRLMSQVIRIRDTRISQEEAEKEGEDSPPSIPGAPIPQAPAAPEDGSGNQDDGGGTDQKPPEQEAPAERTPTPRQPAPQKPPPRQPTPRQPAPAPDPQPAPGGGAEPDAAL